MHISLVRFFRTALILALIQVAFFQVAFAEEIGTRQVEKLQQLMQHSGFSFTFARMETSLTQSGAYDGFTLHDITLIRFGIEDPFKLHSLRLKGIQELSGIGLAANEVVFTGLSWDGRDAKGNELLAILPSVKITGLYLPDPVVENEPLFFYAKTGLILKNLALLRDGMELFSLKTIATQLSNETSTRTATAQITIKQAAFHVENFNKNIRLKRLMADLSIADLIFDANTKAHWNTDTGTLTLQHLTFDHREIGKIVVGGQVGGYSEFLIRRLRAINTDISNLPVEQRDQASMRMLGELSNALTLEHLSVSFNEKTMVKNFIAIQAEAMGLSPEAMAKLLPTLAAIRLSQFVSPQLTQSLRASLTKFLADPHTITLAATPLQPLPVSNILSLALLVPALLLDKLNITTQAQ